MHTFCFATMAFVASSQALASDIGTGHVVTPTPAYTPTNPAAGKCTAEGASLFISKPEPTGQLATALSEASITITVLPTLPCSAIAALPSSVQGDFAALETSWSNWWHSTRSNFSAWASTCTGEYTGVYSDLTRVFDQTSSMDDFTPSATGCPDFVEAGGTAGPGSGTETPPAETSPAGENAGVRRVAGLGGFVVALAAYVAVVV